MSTETRDDLGRVLCCHGRPIMCNECGEDYATELNQPAEVAALSRGAETAKCDTCVHLTPFELSDELFTCPVVNIRIHRDSASVFGCNQHEPKTPADRGTPTISAAVGEAPVSSAASAFHRVVPSGGDSGQPLYTLKDRIAQWRAQAENSRADMKAAQEGALYSEGRQFAFDCCADEAELVLKWSRGRGAQAAKEPPGSTP